ncbi:dihydropteroate synthase [Aestuariibacter halophilus]|uniref:Dihydropteroate synthase n=1 Tax=Fluctibacter halophilus TaxID=226011 RepID=A0ABS8G7K4_9ALTE|nr:dihydropteroate synthase [Aestuariibacter halophilus]MCC2615795.1 dihydropteroate synthase [Aestuariibacter halophilus]
MRFKNKTLSLDRPRIMGILNVTPDSFSDGGLYRQRDAALSHAQAMLEAGADFIDIGGESTRPGAAAVSEQEELDRVIPIIEAVANNLDVVVSVDTSKASVMREAVKAGAGLINDVRALQEPGALDAAVSSGAAVCLMHMQGQPRTMQTDPHYTDVTNDVMQFLQQRMVACEKSGMSRDRLMVDPGFGFGKTLEHNYQLLADLPLLHRLGVPLLVGMSRKSMIGQLLNRQTEDRLAGSLAAATIAAMYGAHIIRVHDVKDSVDAVKVVNALPHKDNV